MSWQQPRARLQVRLDAWHRAALLTTGRCGYKYVMHAKSQFLCTCIDTHTHLAGMTLSAASTYSPHNIRVNMVVPGLVISHLLQLKSSLTSFTSAK